MMILVQTFKELTGNIGYFAAAQYNMGGGKGYPPRNGLVENQYYAGQILERGRFRVLRPDRVCFISEFLSFQLVSIPWENLSEPERSFLLLVYSQKKLVLNSPDTELSAVTYREMALHLERAGYLRWVESQIVEMTLVGEAEVQHHFFNLGTGDNLMKTEGGIRIRHHSIQDHEIDLGRASSLSVNVDGMCIRISTLQDGGAVIKVDHDASHRVYVSHEQTDREDAQVHIDRSPPYTHQGATSIEKQVSSELAGTAGNDTVHKIG